jgi:hypothetical protein
MLMEVLPKPFVRYKVQKVRLIYRVLGQEMGGLLGSSV